MHTKTFIIAEIAQGFEGNPWLCKKYIDLAKRCGADAVKFQIFRADELATTDYPYYDLFKSLEIEPAIWKELIDHANSINIDFLSDIYGAETLDWISKAGIKGVKIHSTDIMNYPLLEKVKQTGLMIYLAVGGSSKEEIANALAITGTEGIALLSGFQAEPNILEDLELDKIDQLVKTFHIPVGYADHVDPASALATALPAVAVMKGATIIEKHLTVDRDNLQLEDYVSALDPEEFKKMVALIRDVEQLPVTNEYKLSEREAAYRGRTKRSIVVTTGMNAGDIVTANNITLLRTAEKGDFFDMNEVVGKKVNRTLQAGDTLKQQDIV
ncbi:MAG: N-acetylneuraminate synthase family protein [Bacteroidota bacterium]